MNLLVVYDVATTTADGRRRLRRVARACEGFGQRVQYSVFEVTCSTTDYAKLIRALTGVMKPDEDRLRIYHLDRNGFSGATQLGRALHLETDQAWTL